MKQKEVIAHESNIHEFSYAGKYGDVVEILHISDVHYDSKKCDRNLLDRHFTEAKKRGAVIFINGDWFDLMQGKYDPRGGKYDIRPEYKHANYLDVVIKDSAEYLHKWGLPIFLCQGNHETNITKRLETNPTERLVERLKFMGSDVWMGQYSGWAVFTMKHTAGGCCRRFKMHYHHGYGGAKRSKGILNADIIQMQNPDADMIVTGHDHNKWYLPVSIDSINSVFRHEQKTIHHIKTGSYKMKDTGLGWETEKGFNTPRLGGWWVSLRYGEEIEVTINEAK